jgi:hypothetical protein
MDDLTGGGSGTFARIEGSGVTLTNTDNTIEGSGLIGDESALKFVNKATVDANDEHGIPLDLNAGTEAWSTPGRWRRRRGTVAPEGCSCCTIRSPRRDHGELRNCGGSRHD